MRTNCLRQVLQVHQHCLDRFVLYDRLECSVTTALLFGRRAFVATVGSAQQGGTERRATLLGRVGIPQRKEIPFDDLLARHTDESTKRLAAILNDFVRTHQNDGIPKAQESLFVQIAVISKRVFLTNH